MRSVHTRQPSVHRKPSASPMNGQLSLFGALCPTCGQGSGYVRRRRGKITLRCVRCDGPAIDVTCGCAGM
jgi:hypothetical protein